MVWKEDSSKDYSKGRNVSTGCWGGGGVKRLPLGWMTQFAVPDSRWQHFPGTVCSLGLCFYSTLKHEEKFTPVNEQRQTYIHSKVKHVLKSCAKFGIRREGECLCVQRYERSYPRDPFVIYSISKCFRYWCLLSTPLMFHSCLSKCCWKSWDFGTLLCASDRIL